MEMIAFVVLLIFVSVGIIAVLAAGAPATSKDVQDAVKAMQQPSDDLAVMRAELAALRQELAQRNAGANPATQQPLAQKRPTPEGRAALNLPAADTPGGALENILKFLDAGGEY